MFNSTSLIRFGRRILVLCFLATAGFSTVVLAQADQGQAIEIPSQSLSATLVSLGQAYGITVIAAERLTANKTAPAISGNLTALEALRLALADTGLAIEQGPAGSLVVVEREEAQAGSGGDMNGSAESDGAFAGPNRALDEIVVEGDAFSATDGYLARSASTATRVPVSVDDIPNTVRVLPTELIDDVRAILPQEVSRFVSGVQDVVGTGTGTSFVIRGFFTNYELLQNGVRYQNSPGDLVGVERIEVVKGPVGSLYGGTGPFAGAVNYISKRPLDTIKGQVRLTGGTDEFLRGEFDIGGPMSKVHGINYRLTAAVESADSFRDELDSEKLVINPSIEFAPSDRFEIRVDGQLIERDYIAGGGFTLDPNSILVDPERTFIPDGQPRSEDRFQSLAYESNFAITDSLVWRSASGWNQLENDPRQGISSTLAGDQVTVNRSFSTFDSTYRQWSFQNDLVFSTDSIFEEAVFLVGHENYDFENEFIGFESGTLNPVDLTVPGSARDGSVVDSFNFGDLLFSVEGDGVYAQAFVKFTPRLSVLAALRHDWVTNGSAFAPTKQDDSDFSPRIGATYRLSDSSTLYTNWAQSFQPNALFPPDQSALAVDDVAQFEVGLRQYLFDRRLLASIAVFNIERNNVVIPDPNSPSGFPFISGGEQRSRGVELDLTGKLAPGWDFLLAYAYTDAEVTGNQEGNQGNVLPGVPDHNISVLTTYELQTGPLQGLSLTAGVTHQTEIAGELTNTVFLDELTRVDLGVAYETDRWRTALNMSNVTDEDSFATDFFNVTPRDRRRLLVTVTRFLGE